MVVPFREIGNEKMWACGEESLSGPPTGAVLQAADSGGVRGKDGIVSHPHKRNHQNHDVKKTAKTKHIKIKGS